MGSKLLFTQTLENMKKLFFYALASSVLIFTSCDDDKTPTNGHLTLNFSGSENLGSDFTFEV